MRMEEVRTVSMLTLKMRMQDQDAEVDQIDEVAEEDMEHGTCPKSFHPSP